jgi:hypothetical protein
VPELYLKDEGYRGASHPAHTNVPLRFSSFNGLSGAETVGRMLVTMNLIHSLSKRNC